MIYIYHNEETPVKDIQEVYEYKYQLEREIINRQAALDKVNKILSEVEIKK